MAPLAATLADIAGGFDGILLDSFGVLVDGAGALPGAAELLAAARGREYLVVTNDASRLPETTAARFARLGLQVPVERILTSGMLLGPYFAERGLRARQVLVLGTDDSREYVRAAGGIVAPIDPGLDYGAIVVADDDGYEFFHGVDTALSATVRMCEVGRAPELVLPNPDLIYPKAPGEFGFTSGGVALLLEAGFSRRLGPKAPRFVPLGKPHSPIYREAIRRLGSSNLLMVGDQLETDIAGAKAVGLATALVTTGVTQWGGGGGPGLEPDFIF